MRLIAQHCVVIFLYCVVNKQFPTNLLIRHKVFVKSSRILLNCPRL
ncbi:Uncharacterised protein [Vibrio cholerae]|nr:Uncharacterised protein [Vibrio cholerae]